jgi:hypothetical protein
LGRGGLSTTDKLYFTSEVSALARVMPSPVAFVPASPYRAMAGTIHHLILLQKNWPPVRAANGAARRELWAVHEFR